MPDAPALDPADGPDPDLVYENYLKTCAKLGIEPTSRKRALGLMQEWNEVLTATAGYASSH